MTEQQLWLIFITAVVTAAVVGFVLGRIGGGGKKRVVALEAEVARQKDEIAGYKREVDSHFDKTATLVAAMAGSYKDLFEHLSSGYEQLSSGSARQLFRDRVVGLLVGGPAAASTADKVSAALAAAGAPAEPGAANDVDATQPEPSSVPSEGDSKDLDAATEKVASDASAEVPANEPDATSADASTPPASETRPDGKEPGSPDAQAKAVDEVPGEQKKG